MRGQDEGAAAVSEPVELLEAILWTPSDGFYLLERHLERISGSARHFQIPIDLPEVRRALQDLVNGLPPRDHKVRVLVGARGRLRVTAQALADIARPAIQRVCLSVGPIHSSNDLLYHKTTHRPWQDPERASHPGLDDVILWNERGEVTESCTANVVAEISGRKATPPVSCGLLGGTFRAHLLAEGTIAEQVIGTDQLRAASSIWLVNSVRKWMPAVLVDS